MKNLREKAEEREKYIYMYIKETSIGSSNVNRIRHAIAKRFRGRELQIDGVDLYRSDRLAERQIEFRADRATLGGYSGAHVQPPNYSSKHAGMHTCCPEPQVSNQGESRAMYTTEDRGRIRATVDGCPPLCPSSRNCTPFLHHPVISAMITS